MKILLIVGSARLQSRNNIIARTIAEHFASKGHFKILNQLDLLPQFNPDLEKNTNHTYLDELIKSITWADKIIFLTPEYIHSIPGILKNAFDWIVGAAALDQKMVSLVVATSSSGEYALTQTSEILAILTGKPLLNEQTLNLSPMKKYFEDDKFNQKYLNLFIQILEGPHETLSKYNTK